MSEINLDFSFPAAPASVPRAESVLAPPFGHAPRPLSFSPQSRPRRHVHRRSAAMSEDLKATDLSVLTAPQLAASAMPSPGLAGSPSSLSLRSSESGTSSASAVTAGSSALGLPAPAGMPSGPPMSPSAVTFAPLPQVPPMPSRDARDASPRRRSSFDRPRMPFASSPASPVPIRRFGNVGEPGQLVPTSPAVPPPPPSPLPSPRDDVDRRKRDRSKRRSFVRVFRRSRDFDADDTLTAPGADTLSERLPSPTPPAPEPPRTPEMVSPILTPRNSGEVLRDLEPEPPRIDLDEALSCSFEHRRPEGILESPFSRTSSIIGTVPEEEEESDAASLASLSQLRPGAVLQKAGSVRSTSSLGRPDSLKPGARPINIGGTAPILLSPARDTPPDKRAPGVAGAAPASAPAAVPVSAAKNTDQLTHLAIVDPRPSPPGPSPAARASKGHTRRRSLISRIMGRNH